MIRRLKLIIFSGAIVTGCAFFDFQHRDLVLTALLLGLPLLDIYWVQSLSKRHFLPDRLTLILGLIYAAVVSLHPAYLWQAISIVFLVALPEEWFYRLWVLKSLDQKTAFPKHLPNVLTSALFAVAHMPTQGLAGLVTFIPSLVLGRFFQKTNNVTNTILLHAIFNLIYFVFLLDFIQSNTDLLFSRE